LAVVATAAENARFYFRFRPPAFPVAADPDFVTHRLYGVPAPLRADIADAFRTTRINPSGELPTSLPIPEASATLSRLEGLSRLLRTARMPPDRSYSFLVNSSWTERALSAGRTSNAHGRVSPGSGGSRPMRNYSLQCVRSPRDDPC
jgi:hypothetical protein